ncbi:MAG TPA: hypothetical protein VGI75_09085 [Pirellulales bacterium]|jgi:hypothetical protein
MRTNLAWIIFVAGFAQWSVLAASTLVPIQLQWRSTLALLPRLHRQLIWCYACYVFATIVALGLVCVSQSEELAAGGSLSRAVCLYGAAFWGARLLLQAVFDVRPYLTNKWLTTGYHTLTLLFISFVAVYVRAIFA